MKKTKEYPEFTDIYSYEQGDTFITLERTVFNALVHREEITLKSAQKAVEWFEDWG